MVNRVISLVQVDRTNGLVLPPYAGHKVVYEPERWASMLFLRQGGFEEG